MANVLSKFQNVFKKKFFLTYAGRKANIDFNIKVPIS